MAKKTDEVEEIKKVKKDAIALFGADFGREDLNALVAKLNEVITVVKMVRYY